MKDIYKIFNPYKTLIEEKILLELPMFGPKTKLRDACEYALLNDGKRFRPILVYLVAKALNKQIDVTPAALAVEYFHTASLIADDLPCMDDDDERRNKPSVHKVYGEATALLVTYALIAAGYENLSKTNDPKVCQLALENASINTGIHGATGGQYLDLFPMDLTRETFSEVLYKKTVTLFEISFVLGWLYGGGDPDQLNMVKKAAYHFGMAFQISDDIGDREQDIINDRKINTTALFGLEKALEMFHVELDSFLYSINNLDINTELFELIAEKLTHSSNLDNLLHHH